MVERNILVSNWLSCLAAARGLISFPHCSHSTTIWMVGWAANIRRRMLFARPISGRVLERSVLLRIRGVASIVLVGLPERVHHGRPDFRSRAPLRASSFPA